MNAGIKNPRYILVIGGAGHIGSILVRALLLRGYRVRVLDSLLYDNISSIIELFDHPNFSFVEGDFCDENISNESLTNITDVVLLGALVGDPICKKYPELARRINEEGTIKLFNGLNGHRINRFIFISTCSNYGLRSSDEYATEASELNPQSLYAETKVNAERHILRNKDSVKFSATILRLSTAYGVSQRMRFDLTISNFCRELTLGRKLIVYDENSWRPYCHVADISAAIIKTIESPGEKVRGEIFNVGSNAENYTKKAIVEMILSHLTRSSVEYTGGISDPRNYRVSFDKITSKLDFKKTFSIKESIPELVQAIKSGSFDDVDRRKEFYANLWIKEKSVQGISS